VFRHPSEPRSERAEIERTLFPKNSCIAARLYDQPNVFLAARHDLARYGISEMLSPNRQGVVTDAVCSSHGNDIDSDKACVTGHSPTAREKTKVSLVCCRFSLGAGWNRNGLFRQAGHPVAGCHGLQAVEEVTTRFELMFR